MAQRTDAVKAASGARRFVRLARGKPCAGALFAVVTRNCMSRDAVEGEEAASVPSYARNGAGERRVIFGLESSMLFHLAQHQYELISYFTALARERVSDFFRPQLIVDTPDINPLFLQTGGRPAFLIRAALACTLSGLWGMYNGSELCEADALRGREEYIDSGKYEIPLGAGTGPAISGPRSLSAELGPLRQSGAPRPSPARVPQRFRRSRTLLCEKHSRRAQCTSGRGQPRSRTGG